MSNKDTAKADAAAAKVERKKNFKGYTMEELRYHRALAALRKEFCKSNVAQSVQSLKNPLGNSKLAKALPLVGAAASKIPAVASASSASGSVGKTIAKTLVSRLSPFDYVMLGISLIGPTRALVKKFRKKK